VFRWLRRRRMSDAGRRRLLIALARAEEDLVETHVRNVRRIQESVGDELALDRALDLYLDAMDPGEPHASIVAQRVLARMEGSSSGRPRRGNRRLRLEEDGSD
jgi:hypothetical protein